jgi:hypothetical protein
VAREGNEWIIHMFAFRLKAGVTEAQRQRMVREISDFRLSPAKKVERGKQQLGNQRKLLQQPPL